MHLKPSLLVVLLMLQCATSSSAVRNSGPAETHPHCDTDGSIIKCTLEESEIISSDPIKLGVMEGQTVEVYAECHQNGSEGVKCLCYQRMNSTMPDLHPLHHFETDENGLYTVICGNYSITVIPTQSPSVPVIKIIRKKDHRLTVQLVCISKGNPKPVISWKNSKDFPIEENAKKRHTAESRVDGNADLHVGCCAKNSLGEECSKTYSYDVSKQMVRDPIFLTSGQSLVLQCKCYSEFKSPDLKWHFNDTAVSGVSSVYFKNWMEYLSIESVNATHSGEYICKSKHNRNVTVNVRVLETDKIDILQMNENNSIMAVNKGSFCIKALVFSHPKAQCHWIASNKTEIKCKETVHNDYNSTFELCGPEPGQYQIKLETRKYSVVRNLSLCISDLPKINISTNSSYITCKTQSSTPTAMFWKTCSSRSKCFNSIEWKDFPVPVLEFPDSDQFCQKKIAFARPRLHNENHLIKCCVTNVAGTHCSERILLQTHSYIYYIICFAFIAVLLFVVFALIIFIKLKKPVYQSQIQMIQMVGPNDNDYIYIDFKDFKYDPRWEFPRENLELGKQLGAGAFGRVVQATAYGISKPGVSLQVAVKMLKDKHQSLEKEALMSELKMLSYIGHHENIVNLLGACTGSGPVFLIFQYCCNGDLLNYLKSNRERFHKYLNDAFNREIFRSLYHNFQQKRNSSKFIEPDDNACLHVTLETKEQENQTLLSPSISSVSTFEEMLKCDAKLQEEEFQSLTYDDLLSFSFQVAKGMEFLSSKHCIHRDLAARNVLVTQGRQVKIGDFGLARDIDNDSNYVVKGNVRLPVKWMAPESIFKGIYTMQSDVWAYGILLWEIFSLGVTPYPGVTVNNTFYTMIESGYHMEQPYYASESVYKVMCRCWSLNPADRPCFSKLVAFMEKELATLEQKLYENFKGDNPNDIYQNSLVTLDVTPMDEK